MDSKLQNLDLIDLIRERHVQLRRMTEELWNENNDIYLSNSEWLILARIYDQKKSPISYVTKNVDISRQATHKFIKQLEAKGLVDISKFENNNKEKLIRLTPLGEECYEKNEALKAVLEKKIADQIGAEHLSLFKDVLRKDWVL